MSHFLLEAAAEQSISLIPAPSIDPDFFRDPFEPSADDETEFDFEEELSFDDHDSLEKALCPKLISEMLKDFSICPHASDLQFFTAEAVLRLRSPIWSLRDHMDRLQALLAEFRKSDSIRLELQPGVHVCEKLYEAIMNISPYMKRRCRKLLRQKMNDLFLFLPLVFILLLSSTTGK